MRCKRHAAGGVVLRRANRSPSDQSQNNRFVFSEGDDGIFRFDTRTGEVSLCSHQGTGWACRLVPDERGTLEGEVTRLQNENAGLKRALAGRAVPKNAPLTGTLIEKAEKPPKRAEPAISGDGFNRAVTVVVQIWRRLVSTMASLKADLQPKT
jgi:hypothetical protein